MTQPTGSSSLPINDLSHRELHPSKDQPPPLSPQESQVSRVSVDVIGKSPPLSQTKRAFSPNSELTPAIAETAERAGEVALNTFEISQETDEEEYDALNMQDMLSPEQESIENPEETPGDEYGALDMQKMLSTEQETSSGKIPSYEEVSSTSTIEKDTSVESLSAKIIRLVDKPQITNQLAADEVDGSMAFDLKGPVTSLKEALFIITKQGNVYLKSSNYESAIRQIKADPLKFGTTDVSKLTFYVIDDELWDTFITEFSLRLNPVKEESPTTTPDSQPTKSKDTNLAIASEKQNPLINLRKQERKKKSSQRQLDKALQERANQENANRIQHRKETAKEKRKENERIEKEIIAKDELKRENLTYEIRTKERSRQTIKKADLKQDKEKENLR
jgi:hypothetical protein